jgi:hypothetical protein
MREAIEVIVFEPGPLGTVRSIDRRLSDFVKTLRRLPLHTLAPFPHIDP